jgi:hypothetical protein
MVSAGLGKIKVIGVSGWLILRGSGGDAGIRTLGTLFEYNALARRRLKPLGHVSGRPSA